MCLIGRKRYENRQSIPETVGVCVETHQFPRFLGAWYFTRRVFYLHQHFLCHGIFGYLRRVSDFGDISCDLSLLTGGVYIYFPLRPLIIATAAFCKSSAVTLGDDGSGSLTSVFIRLSYAMIDLLKFTAVRNR